MKLLLCEHCQDVFKLVPDQIRTCQCGKVKGRYDWDEHFAVSNGQGISVALDNNTIRRALINYHNHGMNSKQDIHAWIRPNSGEHNPRMRIDSQLGEEDHE